MIRRSAVLALAGALSCSGGGKEQATQEKPKAPAAIDAAPPARPLPAAGSVKEALAADAGGEPVILFLDRKGNLAARGIDGKMNRMVVAGPFDWAMHEPAMDLVWALSDTELRVVDLRAPTAVARPIAKVASGARVEVRWALGDNHGVTERPSYCEPVGVFELKWKETIEIGRVDDDSDTSARILDEKWLAAERTRAVHNAAPPAWLVMSSRKGPLPPGARCDEEFCGDAAAFGATGKDLVLVGFELGEDCRHLTCVVRDRDGKTAPPPGAATEDERGTLAAGSCGPFLFDRAGKHYLASSRLCAVDGACQDLGGESVGWLDGAVSVGALR